jgi:ATP-dependent Clp protease ATP-binding subunit ClpC
MSGFNFSPQLRTVLGTARAEACQLHHEYIGTEHILLGLLREEQGTAADAIRRLPIAPEQIRQKLAETLVPGQRGPTGPDLPYTSRSKRVLELTRQEASRAGAAVADTEHLLLALCLEGKGIAAEVLSWAGLTRGVARAAIERRR